MEEHTIEGSRSRARKEVVGYVQSVVGKKEFLVQFEYGQKRDMSSCLFVYLCSKQEICLDVYKPISELPKNNNVNF